MRLRREDQSVKTTIVTTTIHVPRMLDGYVENILAHGHSDVSFTIIGDLKTPPEIRDYLEGLARRGLGPVEYWDVDRQKAWLKRFPDLDRLIPYNSIQRRNLGYLAAYEAGSDVIISIDDDNFVTDDDFVGMHSCVGTIRELRAVRSSTSWFNPCDMLEVRPRRRIYHRGFPHSKRWAKEELSFRQERGRVVVNAGLWLETPDVDAVTHLEEPVEVVGLKSDFSDAAVALAGGTWAPFNSQNTAFHRSLLPCMYLVVMGDRIDGLRVDRFDDIWMSYFTRKIADHLGDYIQFGRPLLRQSRNPHDFMRDLVWELPGMILTNKLIITLEQLELSSGDYLSCYVELAGRLREAVCEAREYTYEEKGYLLKLTDGMRVWAKACEALR